MICIFCSYLVTLATNYAFDSGDVRFDNNGTSLDSVNVQDAIDETFHHVTDYNEIKTIIGSGSLTTTSQNIIGGINELKTDVGTLSSKLTPISNNGTSPQTLSDRTGTSVASISLSAGTWLVLGKVCFQNIKAGHRGISIETISGNFGWLNSVATGYGAGTDHEVTLSGWKIITLSQTTTVHVNAYIAIGESSNIYNPVISAIKLL